MVQDPFSLSGQVVLVAGTSGTVGSALTRALAGAGAQVVFNGHDKAILESEVAAMTAEGLSVAAAPFDIDDEAAAVRAVADIAAAHGRLDVLVNNPGTILRKPYTELELADWQRVIDANVRPCFYLAREALKAMAAQGAGRIITVTTIMAHLARAQLAPYVAAKHALAGLTKSLAVEFGPLGITCNAIAMGYFITDLTEPHLVPDPEFNKMLRARVPLGRWGHAEELANAAVFLASPAASFVNGHILTVDGGLTVAL